MPLPPPPPPQHWVHPQTDGFYGIAEFRRWEGPYALWRPKPSLPPCVGTASPPAQRCSGRPLRPSLGPLRAVFVFASAQTPDPAAVIKCGLWPNFANIGPASPLARSDTRMLPSNAEGVSPFACSSVAAQLALTAESLGLCSVSSVSVWPRLAPPVLFSRPPQNPHSGPDGTQSTLGNT